MAGTPAEQIGSVLAGVLTQARQRSGELAALQGRWGRLVGRALAAHTRPVSLRRGRLVVHAEQPGDGFTLSYQRQRLLERLQTKMRGKIEEIVIRPGEVQRAAAAKGRGRRGRSACRT